MWEAYDLGIEDFLWSCIAFMGGIASNQGAPCGAVSAAAVVLGLRHRCPLKDKERAREARNTIRKKANKIIRSFEEEFGDIICANLLHVDFSEPDGYGKFLESGLWRTKCEKYVQFVVEKLYELEDE